MISTIITAVRGDDPATKKRRLEAKLADMWQNREWLVSHTADVLESRLTLQELENEFGKKSPQYFNYEDSLGRLERKMLPTEHPKWLSSTKELDRLIAAATKQLAVLH